MYETNSSKNTAQEPPPPYDMFVSATQSQQNVSKITSLTDVNIVITEPMKHPEGINGYYWTYKVKTSSNLQKYQQEYTVTRRYRDFDILYERLCMYYKGIIIPPVPEKNVVQKFQNSPTFIEKRRKQLQMFLNRVAQHPILKDSQELQTFVQADDSSWMSIYNQYIAQQNAQRSGVNGALKLIRDFSQQASSLVGQNVDEREEDPEYLKIRDYFIHLERHLLEVQRQVDRLVAKQYDLGKAISEFGNEAEKLGKFEGGALNEALSQLGYYSESLGKVTQTNVDELTLKFQDPIQEYVRMLKGVKQTIDDRTQSLLDYQNARLHRETKKMRYEKLRSVPGTRIEKIGEAQKELEQSNYILEQAESAYNQLRARMSEDLIRFQKERANELAQLLRSFALLQAQLTSESASRWGGLMEQLKRQIPSGNTQDEVLGAQPQYNGSNSQHQTNSQILQF